MINKITKIILYPIKLIFLGLIYFYKIFISPILPKSCIYTPSCSTYGLVAIKRFGPIKGVFLTIKRVMSCNNRSKGGFNPVPDNIKGDAKWVL